MCSEHSSLSFVVERIAQEGQKENSSRKAKPGGSGLVGGDGQGDTQCAIQT